MLRISNQLCMSGQCGHGLSTLRRGFSLQAFLSGHPLPQPLLAFLPCPAASLCLWPLCLPPCSSSNPAPHPHPLSLSSSSLLPACPLVYSLPHQTCFWRVACLKVLPGHPKLLIRLFPPHPVPKLSSPASAVKPAPAVQKLHSPVRHSVVSDLRLELHHLKAWVGLGARLPGAWLTGLGREEKTSS